MEYACDGSELGTPAGSLPLLEFDTFLSHNIDAKPNTLITDGDPGAGDKFLSLVLILAAKGTPQVFLDF